MGVEPISLSESQAIERFVSRTTVPLLLKKSMDSAIQHGSATLFSLNGRHFLITARHIFDEIDPIQLAFPEKLTAAQIFTFGTLNVYTPEDPRFDIAVVEILDRETIERLRLGWQFLSQENIGRPTAGGTFFLSGYPASLTTSGPTWLSGKLFTVYTSRILQIPDEAERPVDMSVDLFFDYGESANDLHHQAVDTPKLQGASGCSIWEYDRHGKRDFWTPENTTKMVGVQSAYIHSKYFRAISWRVVAGCLRAIDPTLNLPL